MDKRNLRLLETHDMTEGAPWKRLMEFALPMLLGNFAQQLYNTADSVIVGKYVGDNTLAAVGSAAPVMNLLMVFFVGIATGAGVVISQNFGAHDRKELSVNIGNCITITLVASIIMMVLGPLITMPMLRALNTPDSIIEWANGYLRIFFLGVAGFFFYNILSGILRGMGDSVSALLFLLLATALNVGLDLLFVIKFHMAVNGVALATILAQFLSAIACFVRLASMRNVFDLNWQMLKPRKKNILQILKIGIPSGVTQGVVAMASMFVQSITNSMGEAVIACNVIVMRVDSFAIMPCFSFGQAISVFAGQNVGAKKMNRVHEGVKQCNIMALAVSVLITVGLLLFGRYLFAFFTETESLIDMAVSMMRIMAVGYICLAISQTFGGAMRGTGDTVTPMWISIFTTIVLRVPVAYLLAWLTRTDMAPHGQPSAIFASLLISLVAGMLLTVAAYYRGQKKAVG